MDFTTILSEARRFTKTNSTSYTTADITQSANRAFDRVVSLIRQANGRWQWDDSNQTDLPFSTASLVTDQQDYTLDPDHYAINRVEVKDEAGNWTKLIPFDQADIFDSSITDFLSGSGIPQYYDKVGNSLLLYPKPSYTQAASIKVFCERGPSYFLVSDTTKEPGFNPMFHRLIPLWCAYDYAAINNMQVADRFKGDIAELETALVEFYARRDKDEHIRLKARVLNYR
jgi:hypothetical protein